MLVSLVGGRAWAQFVYTPETLTIHVQHDTLVFHPVKMVVRVATDPYVSLTDPTMVLFLKKIGATIEVSADLGTVTSRLGGTEVDWDVNANRGVVRGKDVLDLTATAVRNGEVVVSLHALTLWLGLTLAPVNPAQQEYQFIAGLSGIQASVEDGHRIIRFAASGGLTWQFYPNTDGSVRVDFANTVCNLPSDRLDLGGATVLVQSHGSATSATRVQFTADPYWRLQPDNGKGTIDLRPEYPVVAKAADATLTRVTSAPWRLETSDDVGYGWHWSDGVLTLDLVQCAPDKALQLPPPSAGVLKLESQLLCEKPYAVTRLVWHMAPDAGVQIIPVMEAGRRVLTVATGPQVALTAQRVTGFDAGGPVAIGTIVIDPGHGGSDPGAVSPLTGLMEKDVTLDVGLRLQRLLQSQGWKVIMTRSEDKDLTYAGSPDRDELAARAAVADADGVDLFVSIHCNANLNPAARGTSIHWFKSDSYQLACVVRDDLSKALGIPNNGTEQNPFYVVKYTRVPAILIETAYVTNGEDVALLATPEFRGLLAETIAQALNYYMQQYGAARTSKP